MISNQILQNTIEGLKGITRIDFCVMDTDGKPLASTMTEQENYEEEVLAFVAVMMCTWLERLQHFRSRIC